MNLAVVALTKGAAVLGARLCQRTGATLYCKEDHAAHAIDMCAAEKVGDGAKYGSVRFEVKAVQRPFGDFAGRLFESCDGLVFIMATGIVVRSLAPYLSSKVTDPAVVVMDEGGRYAISLLSGHLGGANDLALTVAEAVGAQPVITTASDVTGTLAVDMLSKRLGTAIDSMEAAKAVTAIGVSGGKISIYSENPLPEEFTRDLPGHVSVHVVTVMDQDEVKRIDADRLEGSGLIFISSKPLMMPHDSVQLIVKNHSVGIGCRRGTDSAVIRRVFEAACQSADIHPQAVRTAGTISLKADEAGLLEFVKERGMALQIISNDEVKKVQDQFEGSDFVEKTTGVRAVAEPCAMIAGGRGRMRLPRYADQGVTIAIWEEDNAFQR